MVPLSTTVHLSLATRRLGNQFLSVGRVQSPTLALIVEREKERRAFVPVPYWVITVDLLSKGQTFTATHKEERFLDEARARARLLHGDRATIERKRRAIALALEADALASFLERVAMARRSQVDAAADLARQESELVLAETAAQQMRARVEVLPALGKKLDALRTEQAQLGPLLQTEVEVVAA